MMNKTLASSDSLPNPESGATDSQWPPSWWRWLIFALSGTVEIERQDSLQRQRDEDLKKRDEEQRKQHEIRISELKKENARLAEIESKLDVLVRKSASS